MLYSSRTAGGQRDDRAERQLFQVLDSVIRTIMFTSTGKSSTFFTSAESFPLERPWWTESALAAQGPHSSLSLYRPVLVRRVDWSFASAELRLLAATRFFEHLPVAS
jgi:hypothetical protein